MEGSATNKKIIKIVISILITCLPLWLVFKMWYEDARAVFGVNYIYENMILCFLALLVMIIAPALISNKAMASVAYSICHLIFWLPLFYGAATETRFLFRNVTTWYWVSIALAMMSLILQICLILCYKTKR